MEPENTNLLKKFLPLILIATVILLVFLVIFIASLFVKAAPSTPNNTGPSPTIFIPTTFSVTKTSPEGGAASVYPGEISITFDTNTPIRSTADYALQVSPPLSKNLELLTEFPSTHVSYGVVGGLEKNTTYTINVKNYKGDLVWSWSFSTSSQEPESSTREVTLEQEGSIEDYYPLFSEVPYEAGEFNVDYIDRLTLEVNIFKGTKSTVEPQINAWMLNNRVDPQSHKINYVQN